MNKLLGTKLRTARENAGLTQDVLAKAVNLSPEYISLLELGKRSPSLKTLIRLSDYFKKDLDYFLLEKEDHFSLLLKSEKLGRKEKFLLKKFRKLCQEYINLEELTGNRVEPAPLYTRISAGSLAREERRRIGLGNEPLRNVFSLVELNGLRVIRLWVPEETPLSGVFLYFDTYQTAFALVNSAQPLGQQALIAAHEYCHFLRDRHNGPIIDNPDIFIREYVSLYHPREQFAQKFALSFLVPPEKIIEFVGREIRLKNLRFEDVLFLKHYFGVSTLTMMQVLKELEFLSQDRYEEYRKIDGLIVEQTVCGEAEEEKRIKRRKKSPLFSSRFRRLAVEAYRKKKISLEKLAALLDTDSRQLLTMLK
ncbi:MAG: helix-turn-helix domain-containing protein [Candidatus Aminicenantales bacterium]